MNEQDTIKLLNALEDSPAWAHIRQTMEREILRAALEMGKRASMPEDEMHFRRGAIWAGERMLDLPRRLRSQLENELLMRGETTPATAGSLSATADTRRDS